MSYVNAGDQQRGQDPLLLMRRINALENAAAIKGGWEHSYSISGRDGYTWRGPGVGGFFATNGSTGVYRIDEDGNVEDAGVFEGTFDNTEVFWLAYDDASDTLYVSGDVGGDPYYELQSFEGSDLSNRTDISNTFPSGGLGFEFANGNLIKLFAPNFIYIYDTGGNELDNWSTGTTAQSVAANDDFIWVSVVETGPTPKIEKYLYDGTLLTSWTIEDGRQSKGVHCRNGYLYSYETTGFAGQGYIVVYSADHDVQLAAVPTDHNPIGIERPIIDGLGVLYRAGAGTFRFTRLLNQSRFHRYPTLSLDEKQPLAPPDGGVLIPHESDYSGVGSSSDLVYTGNANNDEWVKLGVDTYTYKTALTGAAYEVKIGGTQEASRDNLVAAIMNADGEGSLYGIGTLPNTLAGAIEGPTADILRASAYVCSSLSDLTDTTTNMANASWLDANLGDSNAHPFRAGLRVTRMPVVDMHEAIEELAQYYVNVDTGNPFNWTDSDPDNLYWKANGEDSDYDWTTALDRVRAQDLNEIANCLTLLEASERV